MSIAKIYNQEGKEVSEIKLNEAVFDLPWNADLVHQAVRVAFANQRQVLSSTKDRSEVRGGGRKPWRQKGTGRARHGSIRSPLWKGGGVTFGPTSARNFKLSINKKMAKKALLTVLSAKAKDGEILVLDNLKLPAPARNAEHSFAGGPKTKEMAKIISNFSKVKTGLLVMAKPNEDIKRAARNLPNFEIININNLNILDVLKCQHLIITKDGVEELNKIYAVSK